jgi:hypothetical protein
MTCACGNSLTFTYSIVHGQHATYFSICDRCQSAPKYYSAHVAVRSSPSSGGVPRSPMKAATRLAGVSEEKSGRVPFHVAGQLLRLHSNRPCPVGDRGKRSSDVFAIFSRFRSLARAFSRCLARYSRTSLRVLSQFNLLTLSSSINHPFALCWSGEYRVPGVRGDVQSTIIPPVAAPMLKNGMESVANVGQHVTKSGQLVRENV